MKNYIKTSRLHQPHNQSNFKRALHISARRALHISSLYRPRAGRVSMPSVPGEPRQQYLLHLMATSTSSNAASNRSGVFPAGIAKKRTLNRPDIRHRPLLKKKKKKARRRMTFIDTILYMSNPNVVELSLTNQTTSVLAD